MANTDFRLKFSGGDCGANTYSISANYILKNFAQGPGWGTNYPLGGWERFAQGPNCIGWHLWAYIKNDATGRTHGYVRADIYLKAWSPTGPFEAHILVQSPNMWNTIEPTSELYNQPIPRFAAFATLYNGSAPVAYFGGPKEYRAQTLSPADFNTANNTLTMKFVDGWMKYWGGGLCLSSTGDYPAGLDGTSIYWPTSLWGVTVDNPHLATCGFYAGAAIGNAPRWQKNTAYFVDQTAIVDGVMYICVQAGTSSTTSGPSGIGDDIVDGTVHWQNMTVPFTSQGSGVITLSPINAVYAGTAWVGGDINGDPVWIGKGRRPRIVAGENFRYLTTRTKAVPPYGLDAPTYFFNGTPRVYNPMGPSFGYFYISTGGDGPGDQRIGYLNEDAVNVLYNPADSCYYNSSLQQGLMWANWPAWFTDERSGYPVTANNGPTKSGTSYPHMASPQPKWSVSQPTAFGVGKPVSPGSRPQDQNGFEMRRMVAAEPTSHMPNPWYGPYLQTGYMVLHDIALQNGNWVAAGYQSPDFQTITFEGTKYYCVINSPYVNFSQERAWGWAARILANSRWICRDASPMQPYLYDLNYDSAFVQDYFYTHLAEPASAAFGFLSTGDHLNPASQHGTLAPWMWSYVCSHVAMEAWRGTDKGHWAGFLKFVVNRFKLYEGDGIAYVGAYDISYSAVKNKYATCFTTQLDVFNSTLTEGFNGKNFPRPYPQQPYMYDGIQDGNLRPDFPGSCNCIPNQVRMALTLCCTALPSNTGLRSQLANWNKLIGTLTGVTKHGQMDWCAPGQNHKVYCCYEPAN